MRTIAALLLALLLPLRAARSAQTGDLKPDRLVPYKTVDDVTLKLHVFKPAGIKPTPTNWGGSGPDCPLRWFHGRTCGGLHGDHRGLRGSGGASPGPFAFPMP